MPCIDCCIKVQATRRLKKFDLACKNKPLNLNEGTFRGILEVA
jgi:hypothetical protein